MRPRPRESTVYAGSLISRLPDQAQPAALWLRSVTGWGSRRRTSNQPSDPEPFNAQHERAAIIRALIERARVTCAIETGTFHGVTTEYLATIVNSVVSVEVDPFYYSVAAERLSEATNVTLHLGDSRTVIHALSIQPSFTDQVTLFYLDAHWGDDLPLADELTMIGASWSRAIVVIDDFEVPGDSGYGFDNYGPGVRLDRTILPPRAKWRGAYPSIASEQETGSRRGWVVLTSPELSHVLEQPGLAAPWALSPPETCA